MPSARVAVMLARAGYHPEAAPGRARTWRVVLGSRWLLRPREVRRIADLVPRWAALGVVRRARIAASLRPLVLWRDPDALPWDIIRVRDKEGAKLSLFDLAARTKTVVWDARADLERELTTQAAFVAHGVPMLALGGVDPAAQHATQPLRGELLAHADSLAPIAEHLLAYAVATAELEPIAVYRARVREPLPPAVAAALDELTAVPVTLVHGDLSAGNIVREGGQAWLIDLDRAFMASASYDFVYAWVTRGDVERPLVDRALAALLPEIPDGAARARVGLALFIADNLAYLARCATAAARKHTQGLVRGASSRLAAAA